MAVFLLALLVLAGVGVLLLQRRRRQAAQRRREARERERTLFDLRLGDIVQAEAADWVVEDRLLYDQDGFQWLEYLLRDGGRSRWLVVCEDDWLEVSWLEPVDLVPPPPLPLPPELTWHGATYRLQEQGTASVTASHRRMNQRLGRCRFADYTGPGERVLGLEVWAQAGGAQADAEIEATAGRLIDPRSLTLLPGDGRSVYRSAAD
ncbi:DUF4178 domain-containing protein [Cyanobium sp. CH-040]|nr:DUF4178 domain-containing protein [Cyanobium sp. CH-040]